MYQEYIYIYIYVYVCVPDHFTKRDMNTTNILIYIEI